MKNNINSSYFDKMKHNDENPSFNVSESLIQADAIKSSTAVRAVGNTYITCFKRARVMAKRITNMGMESRSKAIQSTGFMATTAGSAREPFSISVVVNETVEKNCSEKKVSTKSMERPFQKVVTAIGDESSQGSSMVVATKRKYNKPVVINFTDDSACDTENGMHKKKKRKNTKSKGKARPRVSNRNVKKTKYISKRSTKKTKSPQKISSSSQTIEKYPETEEMKNIPCKFFYLGVTCPDNEKCKFMHNMPLDQHQMDVLIALTFENLFDYNRDIVYFCEIQKIIKNRLIKVQKSLQLESNHILTRLQEEPPKMLMASDMPEQIANENKNYSIPEQCVTTTTFAKSLNNNESNSGKKIPEETTMQNDKNFNNSMQVLNNNINKMIAENVEKFLQSVQASNLIITEKNKYLKQLHDLLQNQMKNIMQQIEAYNNLNAMNESCINVEQLVLPISNTKNSDENLKGTGTLTLANQDMANICNESDNITNKNGSNHNEQCPNYTAPDTFIADADCIDDFPGVYEEVTYSLSYEKKSNNRNNTNGNGKTQEHSEKLSDVNLPKARGLEVVEILDLTSNANQLISNETDKTTRNTSAVSIETFSSCSRENNYESSLNADDNSRKLQVENEENLLRDSGIVFDSSLDKTLEIQSLKEPIRTCGTTVAAKDNYLNDNHYVQNVKVSTMKAKDPVENIGINNCKVSSNMGGVQQLQKERQCTEQQTIQIDPLNENKIRKINTHINITEMDCADRVLPLKRWKSFVPTDPRIFNAMKADSVYNNLVKNNINVDMNVKAHSTPISSPVYVDIIASPSPIRNKQLATFCNTTNYATKSNAQQNYLNMEYKLYEIDIPPKQTVNSLNIDKKQTMSNLDPRLHRQLKNTTSTRSSSPEFEETPSSYTKQQSHRNKKTLTKKNDTVQISSEVTDQKQYDDGMTEIEQTQNPNMLLYWCLQRSSWYHDLVSTSKIYVNQSILHLVKALNDFHHERSSNPHITFDIFKLDDADQLIDIMKNLRIYIDEYGFINTQSYKSMYRKHYDIKKALSNRKNKYAEYGANSSSKMRAMSPSFQGECNNSNSSSNTVTTHNSSLMAMNEPILSCYMDTPRLKYRKLINSAASNKRTYKYDSDIYWYSSRAKRRYSTVKEKEYPTKDYYWRKSQKRYRYSDNNEK